MKTILSLKAICLCFIWFLSVDAVQAHKDKTWQPKALNVHDSTFVPDYTLRISASDIQINCETRHSVVLNGTSPGPTLRLKQNQIVWIRVYNDMPDTNSTIHWHGLSQRVAPFSDGTPQASQWPIPPGHFFDYEIYPDKAGTFMYHSHVGFQAVSCYGALIVEEATKPVYQYDEELVILIADYFNQTDKPIEQGLMADPFVWSGGTNAILFNGQSGTAIGSGAKDQSCQPMPLQVKPDTTYRVRLICATAISFVTIGLEGHDNLTIIEADGTDSKPYSTDHIQMGSGQRYSLLLRTKSAADCKSANKYSYWLRYENREEVDSSMAGYGLFEYNVPGIASAQLAALPASPPMNLPTQVTDWTEYALSPFNPSLQPFPTKADRTLHIKVEQKGIAVNGKVVSRLEWAQNGDVWKEEKIDVPYMVQFYKEGASAFPDWDLAIANNGWDPRNLAFPAKTGEVIDIIWESNNSPTGGFEVSIPCPQTNLPPCHAAF